MKEQYKKYTELVDKHKQLILDTERYLWKHPQVGYKEWEATEYLVRQYEKMGFQVKTAEGIPGFIADLDTGRPGPKLALIGELDSLIARRIRRRISGRTRFTPAATTASPPQFWAAPLR